MRSLVLWGQAPLADARARAEEGARVLLWGRPADEESALRPPVFDAPAEARIEATVAAWVATLGNSGGPEGRPFADLFSWNEVPLWPLVRRFFSSPRSLAGRCLRQAEAFTLIFETELPDEVEGRGLVEDEALLLERVCTARGLLFHGGPAKKAPRSAAGRSAGLLDRMRGWRQAFAGGGPEKLTAEVVFVRPEPPAGEMEDAFERLWRVAREEMALAAIALGGEGEPAPEELLDGPARAAAAEAEGAFARSLEALKAAPSTAAAFRHDGVPFADLAAEADLRTLLEEVLPAAVRRAEGVRAVLRRTSAKVLCAVVHDALALRAARLSEIPVVALTDANDGPRALLALERAARGTGMVG